MYSFGKEVRDLKEAEKIAIEMIEKGKFNNFLKKAKINKVFLIDNITVAECFTLGIDYDIFLEDCFDSKTQQTVIDEIKKRESYADNSLIVGNSSMYLEDSDDLLFGFFLCSDAFSKTNSDKILLLAIGFALGEDIAEAIKQFVIVK